jgi:spermidine synthase
VAGVVDHPKVRIEIDDARRWLVRNRERRFDVIVSNTTPHWRAHVTNLLSAEFLALAKSRLNPGGILFYTRRAPSGDPHRAPRVPERPVPAEFPRRRRAAGRVRRGALDVGRCGGLAGSTS